MLQNSNMLIKIKDALDKTPNDILIEIISTQTVNYAAVQNLVPIVHSVRIQNNTGFDIKDIDFLISANPSFISGQKFHLEHLLAGEIRTFDTKTLDLKPDHTYFSTLNEAEQGNIEVKVIASNGIVVNKINSIEILAHNEWGGTRGLPELLAAFVQPNSLIIDRLLGMASNLLKSSDILLSMDGYQSKSREKIWKQVSAIYSILSTQGLQYGPPPASFESTGQKIRSAERILDAQIATCLDSSVLIAACFEQAGLNPVIFLKEGHAWVGVWLINNSFPTPIIDCAQSVRKRIDSGELLMLESTAITQSGQPSLQWARSTANSYLEEETTTFTYAVDIKRARQIHIRSLKEQSGSKEQNAIGESNTPQTPKIEDMPSLPPLDPELLPVTELVIDDTPQGRLSRWKNKLLDLTLRNKLLNFKPGKTFLKVICANPNQLEDILDTDNEFKLTFRPPLMQDHDPRSAELFFQENGLSPIEAHAQKVLANRELIFDVPENEFGDRLTDIYRSSKNAIEETGANTLYISMGMLYWKESADSEVTLKAPLLLLPVSLKRTSVRAGIRLVHREDDEITFNPTLLQKLLDFEIRLPFAETPLRLNNGKVDVGLILQKVRKVVEEIKGFEVRPDCYLGNFSFAKYVMWKDLDSRAEDLAKSKVVNHLINNKSQAFVDDSKSIDPRELDDHYPPHSLFTPLISDSSQLAVVCTASNGKNMVVEGPPGTGKSQTITNMIAHFLASGKTVLFVAEKMAALEVVHKRLTSLGLAEFCLELHSSKAKKSEIAKEFVHTLDITHSNLQSDWQIEAEKLGNLRSKLTTIVKVLHKQQRNGLSIYEAMGVSIANSGKTTANFSWPDADIHDMKKFAELKDQVAIMAALAKQLNNIANHPLSEIGQTQWTPTWQDSLISTCQSLSSALLNLHNSLEEFSKITHLNLQTLNLQDLAALDRLAGSLIQACTVPSQLVAQAHQQDSRQRLQSMIKHGQNRNQIWNSFPDNYAPEIKVLNAQNLQLQWRIANQKMLPIRWFHRRKITNQIKQYSLNNTRLVFKEVDGFLSTLNALNIEDKFFSENNIYSQEILGSFFDGTATNWEEMQSHLDWMENYSKTLIEAYQNRSEELAQIRSRLKDLICNSPEMFETGSLYYTLAINLRKSYNEFVLQLNQITLLAAPRTPLCGGDKIPGILTNLSSTVSSWQINKSQLQPWCVWQLNKSNANIQGLQGLIECVETGDINLSELSTFFDYSYKIWWVKKMVDKEPLLSNFSGATHEHKITEFKKLDEEFEQLTQKYIIAKLRGQIPNETEIKGELNTEIAFLRREAQKQRQHKPIRQVIAQSRNVLTRIKPCLLMSPLSVAQFLDTGHAQFDVVIFDEASQIPTWDAVGAIARGKQLVCVGDPKQLPPTNFFNTTDSDGIINEGDIEEMESILDECLSFGMKPCTLDWHYRSKSENLITFSNMLYYENRLITFPSPVTHDQSVKFVPIDGIYDAGKSRTNRKEAEAIVEAITEHYVSGKGKELSIGVITFNSTQQALIDKLMDDKRMKTPSLEMAISESLAEPFFVKNLENVQGDERDIILFSITFGKTINGKLSMNFGPMNKEGGHRRLNVAASRARHEIRIFSSLRPEHIDLTRTKSRGIADLKAYLDFALNGPRALAKQALPTGREPDSPFEIMVINALRDHGWVVHPQVGVSGYRIDIGVVNPHEPGRYLLGIECDGATYHSAANARDRDRLRQMILEQLGWKIHRIWSTDWWLNPETPKKKMFDHLNELEQEALNMSTTKNHIRNVI